MSQDAIQKCKPEVQPKEGGVILSPNSLDVINGRGGKINAHEGNVRFRAIIAKHKKEYLETKRKSQKFEFTMNVLKEIRDADPPVRFLTGMGSGDKKWYEEIGDVKAVKKVAQALREDGPGFRQAQNMLKSNNIHHHHQHIPPLVHVHMHSVHRLHPVHHPYIPMYECPIPVPSSYFNTPIFPREALMNTHDVSYPPNPVPAFGSNKKATFSLDSEDSSPRSVGNTFGSSSSSQQEAVTFSHLSQESKNQTGFRGSTSDESDERLKRRVKEDKRLPLNKRRKKGIFSDSRLVRTSSCPPSDSESDSDSNSNSDSDSDSDSEDSVIFLPYCVGARSS